MGNRRLYKIECLHTLGTPDSKRVKVTALNLWEARQPFGYEELPVPPTRPPLLLFRKIGLFILRNSLPREAGRVRGKLRLYLLIIGRVNSPSGIRVTLAFGFLLNS